MADNRHKGSTPDRFLKHGGMTAEGLNITELVTAGRQDEAIALLGSEFTYKACTGSRSARAALQFATRLAQGDVEATARWMSRPAPGLGGRTPIDVAEESDEGLQEVLNLIGRVEYGVYS